MSDATPRLDLPYTGIPTFLRCRHLPDLAESDAEIAILGIPTDEGGPWKPGARFGPRAIREQSVRFAGDRGGIFDIEDNQTYLRRELQQDLIVDCGDVDIVYTNRELTFEHITSTVRQILSHNALPVLLGGDHGVTYPVLRAWNTPLTVIQFDAHLDYKPPTAEVSLSNGMPFALARDLPHIEQLVQIGIRSLRTRPQDLALTLEHGNLVRTARQFRQQGITALLDQIPAHRPLYVSIDIDVLDLALVAGCASSEPGGLSYDELRDALAALARHAPIAGFDIVEINPMLDVPSGATALLGAQISIDLLGRLVQHPGYRKSPGRASSYAVAGC